METFDSSGKLLCFCLLLSVYYSICKCKVMADSEPEPKEDEYLKDLSDINWDEDWDDVERLCGGSDSLCCVDTSLHLSTELIEDNSSPIMDGSRFVKCVDYSSVSEAISKSSTERFMKHKLGNVVAQKCHFSMRFHLCMTHYVSHLMHK